MKKHYLILTAFLIGSSAAFSQQTITSVQNGNASSPLTWDCFCFPSTDDHVIINHHVAMDVDWLINGAGSITVNSSGSLIQNGTHALAIDGGGSELTVSGIFTMQNVSVTNGADVHTNASGTINVIEGMYVGNTCSYNNQGTTAQLDSLLTEGIFTNTGTLIVGNLLNTGTFTNNGGIMSDSLGNTGTFNIPDGYVYSNAFGTSATAVFTQGLYHTAGNFYNTGDLTTGTGFTIEVLGNFLSGDTIGGTATFAHDGLLSVAGDIYFADDVSGSGDICVNNNSYNAATITGTLDFCDATGGYFDLDLGNIAGTVTYCSPGCSVGLTENFQSWSVYPNPAADQVKLLGIEGVEKMWVYGITGELVGELKVNYGSLDVSSLTSGTYFILPVTGLILSPIRLTVE